MSEALGDTFIEEQTEELTFPATLPVLPLKDTVVFPESVTPLAIGQERSVKLVEDVVSGDRVLALLTVKNPEAEQPGWDDLYEVGTAAVIHKMIKVPDGTLRILVQGMQRIRLDRMVQDDPYLMGEFVESPDELPDTPEVQALTRNVQSLFGRVIGLVPYLPEELQLAAANVDDPSALCNLVASTLRLKTEEKQQLLELTDVEARLREISAILNRELEVFELGSKIQSQVQEEMEKGQREFFLRQQLKAIQDELGESDPEAAEIAELRSTFDSMELPEDVRKVVDRELARLEKLPTAAAEYGVIRTYLDWIASLPWHTTTVDNLDLDNAKQVLDEDHFDLEQNKIFRDHYLDLPFDLSKTLFICTANTLDTVPAPLLDRMDVIQLSGYTEDEKFGIAKRYLVPKQVEAHGLGGDQITISDRALRLIIREYTREAGVRNLERRLADVLRKAARQVAEGKLRGKKVRVDEKRVRAWLGPRRYEGEVRKRTSEPGVATGLAFTAVGGDILFFEATAYPGKGRLTITGQLGRVTQESAQAALSWVRAHAEALGLEPEWFREHDIHLHVPAGAVPKDGPSAGITMATAIASLVRNQPVSEDVGMTGEITLTGQVLPIGGVREKTLAAQRAGLRRIIMPRDNEPDLEELPKETKQQMEFILVDTIDQVFDAAFDGQGRTRPKT